MVAGSLVNEMTEACEMRILGKREMRIVAGILYN